MKDYDNFNAIAYKSDEYFHDESRAEFLHQVFKYIDGLIEIRLIDKQGLVSHEFFTIDQLQNYKSPTDRNVYFGVYSRAETDGTAKGCKTTGTLWADYDNMSLHQVKQSIKEAGLPEPSIYVNSGHGIHSYWLLEKRENDTTATLKAIALATGADTKATDTARIMRLPGSINMKGDPVKCEIIESASNRYSLDLFKKILNVPIVLQVPDIYKIDIPELNNSNKPCIRAISKGVTQGNRNFAEGRLIKYLQQKGSTRADTKAIILNWNRNNEPPIDEISLVKDFEAYWKTDYKLLGCCIDNIELQSILYVFCNKGECIPNINVCKIKLENNVTFNNRLFNYIHKLTGYSLVVLGILDRNRTGLTISLLNMKLTNRVTDKICMSRSTLMKSLRILESIGLIETLDGNRRAGKENLYKPIPQGTFGKGYTLCSYGAIHGAIDGRVTAAEFKLYVLLLKYAFDKGSCYPSQMTLSKELRVSQSNVSMILTSLEKHDYIKKNTYYQKGVESLTYSLLV